MQLLIRQYPHISRFPFKKDRCLVPFSSFEVTVNAINAHIQLPADKPPSPLRTLPRKPRLRKRLP